MAHRDGLETDAIAFCLDAFVDITFWFFQFCRPAEPPDKSHMIASMYTFPLCKV